MAKEEVFTPPESIIEMLMLIVEMRNMESAQHGLRVADLSGKIGQEMGLGERDLLVLRRGALLHDIGLIAIPDRILHKNDELTAEEWAIMRRHPENGARLLRKIPSLGETVQVILFHHERWDGTGYPTKLEKEKIPILARICAVVEVYDSLANDLPSRKAWPKMKAIEAIEQETGTAYDPNVVKAFIKAIGA